MTGKNVEISHKLYICTKSFKKVLYFCSWSHCILPQWSVEKCLTLPIKCTGPFSPWIDSLEHSVHSKSKQVQTQGCFLGQRVCPLRCSPSRGHLCEDKMQVPLGGGGDGGGGQGKAHLLGLIVLCCERASERSWSFRSPAVIGFWSPRRHVLGLPWPYHLYHLLSSLVRTNSNWFTPFVVPQLNVRQ